MSDERTKAAHDQVNQMIEDQIRSMYRHVYGAGFFWGFVTALSGAVAFYFL